MSRAPFTLTVLARIGRLSMLENELFGHERGSSTGAIAQKTGRVELAQQGSLFLDEIGDIPLELQPKHLRVLQERE
jgi:formate hydrogenlyase transcriptional activator